MWYLNKVQGIFKWLSHIGVTSPLCFSGYQSFSTFLTCNSVCFLFFIFASFWFGKAWFLPLISVQCHVPFPFHVLNLTWAQQPIIFKIFVPQSMDICPLLVPKSLPVSYCPNKDNSSPCKPVNFIWTDIIQSLRQQSWLYPSLFIIEHFAV